VYSPVNARSVPFSRSTRNCAGVSFTCATGTPEHHVTGQRCDGEAM
jgi:hypothetical protein